MKLPKFLYKKIISHNTSLGDNSVFPPDEDISFEYRIIKKRYHEIMERLNSSEFKGIDTATAVALLTKLIKKCKEREEPIKENLVKVCENTITKLFNTPLDCVVLNCELVDKIHPRRAFQLTPEGREKRQFDFEDLLDFDNVSKVILKRRFINSLTLGGAYKMSSSKYFLDEIYELDGELPSMYDKIRLLSDFLLFSKEEKITDEHPMQGSCVEVELGAVGEKTVINAQGIIFPFLLNEVIRGFIELFASHGLPKDNAKASYIISQSDFLLAEPWDLRFGVELWDIVCGDVEDTKLIPYYFMDICEMQVDEFNEKLKEVLAQTKQGKSFQNSLLQSAQHDFEYNEFVRTVQLKNSEKAIIQDSYMDEDEIDSFIMVENAEEEGEDPLVELIQHCTPNDIYIDLELVEGEKEHGFYNCTVSIDDVDLPLYVIDLKCETCTTDEGELLYVPHIEITPNYQHMGLGYKIYKTFVECVGSILRSEEHTYNHREMDIIFDKLNLEPNITVENYGDGNGNIKYRVARLQAKN